jgi:indole-3-glycerol phosphate synthase
MGYLDEKARQVRLRRAREAPRARELDRLRRRAMARNGSASLETALRSGDRVALIAEFKRRSPSAGRLVDGERPDDVARMYRQSGAAGLSVLTDAPDFGGSLADLRAVTATVELPTLRKDFILDVAGLFEARLAGAAAALLIARILSRFELRSLVESARSVGLETLVEIHDEAELNVALEVGSSLIGINNRDLGTLTTDLGVTDRLAPRVPSSVTLVSESGITSADDVSRVRDAGAHGVLVGESLLRMSPQARAGRVSELSGVKR